MIFQNTLHRNRHHRLNNKTTFVVIYLQKQLFCSACRRGSIFNNKDIMKIRPGRSGILIFAGLIVAGLFLVFRPIPVSRNNSIVFNTTVFKISEGAEKNIIFKFDQGHGTYYINHGLQKGLKLDTLQEELVNKKVTVLYLKPSFVSGFSPVADTKYITELRTGDKVIYSELED